MTRHRPTSGLGGGQIPPHPPGFRLRRGRNWFFLGLTYASYYLCRYNLGIIAPELKSDLGLSNAQYGSIQSARDGAYAVGQFVNGLFTDRLGGKQAMTFGAIGTVILNILFGLTAWSNLGWLFFTLFVIRLADGYVQAFGAPGMVKINAAWFRRRERGAFAGIFGGMIQLGAIGVGQLGRALATGFAVPLIFFTITVPELDWRYMFLIPPAIVVIIIILMNLMVRNHPEEAGYRIVHEDETHDEDPHARLSLGEVFRTITSNRIVWIVACAYFCTGFVRRSIESWWVLYLDEVWGAGKASAEFIILVWVLPATAFLGSYGSGVISDRLVAGRRAPVAALIYLSESLFTTLALLLSLSGRLDSIVVALLLLVGINVTCNSTHSILGAAAPMDLGGRKMAGFALGIIDSFQYLGAMLAGFGLGRLLDYAAQMRAQGMAAAGGAPPAAQFDATAWFGAMLPFGMVGAALMMYLWFRYRGTGERGT